MKECEVGGRDGKIHTTFSLKKQNGDLGMDGRP
jgi:hypothetical protein